jgi:hypothetical protein
MAQIESSNQSSSKRQKKISLAIIEGDGPQTRGIMFQTRKMHACANPKSLRIVFVEIF